MKKSNEIIITFKILGTAIISAYTATFRPLFLLITLRGLNTLSSLIILTILILLPEINNENNDSKTITKSMKFHPFLRYDLEPFIINPKAIIFIVASIANKIVKVKSV